MASVRCPIRFTGASRAMRLLGFSRANSWIDVDESSIHVRMGWSFDLVASRAAVIDAHEDDRRVLSWGVHGWRGRWLVNGSSEGIVRIDFEPAQRGRLGPFPLRVRELRVSVDDPRAVLYALATRR